MNTFSAHPSEPAPPRQAAPKQADILAIGGGAAGLIAAIALARTGARVMLIGRKPPSLPGRTVALFDGSLQLLDQFGLLAPIEPLGADVRAMRIIDDTGSIFNPGVSLYEASEIGLDRFGLNIPNDDIVRALDQVAENTPGLTRLEAFATQYDFQPDQVVVTLDTGARVAGKLVAAGDGRNSIARKTAEIAAREWSYPQIALTMILRHRRPHEGATTEYHTRKGPFTFVPMPPLPDAPHRSSLVWLVGPQEADRLKALSRADLGTRIAQQAHYRFGSVEVEGEIGAFPMAGMRTARVSAHRLMLVGEACHVFPPLAAQGLNLGIRDSADAAAALEGVDLQDDAQLEAAIARFETSRRADIDLRTGVVDLLNRSLLSKFPPLDLVRALGMAAAANIGPLRRAILREGISPSLSKRLEPLARLRAALPL